jgi:plasmid stabilization system protein ParE
VAFKVILTEAALADFERLMEWSRENYPANTEEFGAALLNHLDLLKAFPFVGTEVKDFAGVRRLLHSPLHVYYRVFESNEKIEILRFRHASRRPLKPLK